MVGAVLFFFSSRRRHTRLQGDWSSDVCSSDLQDAPACGIESGGGTGSRKLEGVPGVFGKGAAAARQWRVAIGEGEVRAKARAGIQRGGERRPGDGGCGERIRESRAGYVYHRAAALEPG